MPKYIVKTTVDFYGEVEADTPEEAEQMGWNWDEDPFVYDGVNDITVEESEEDEDDE